MKFPSKTTIKDRKKANWIGIGIITGASTYYFYQYGILAVILLFCVEVAIGAHSFALGQTSLLTQLCNKLNCWNSYLDTTLNNEQTNSEP